MLCVSKRATRVIASPIRKFLPLVMKAEKRGIKVFKLNVGDPSLTPPTAFWRALENYPQKNLGYAPSPGIKEHVAAWQTYYATLGINLEAQNIIPTVGGAEAILLSMMAIADVGDEIIVFEPLYTSYKGFAEMAGVKLIPVTLKLENNFALPADSVIEKKINKKTKAIIIINPNNPTGSIFSKNELNRIISIARKHNLFIISDETYREIIFQGKPSSVLQFPKAKQISIVLDSASKRFSCPGARLGAIVSLNTEVMSAVLKFAMVRLSAPTLEQYALIPLLKNTKLYTKNIASIYKKQRDAVLIGLRTIPGISYSEPQGAFYIILKLPIKNADDFIRFMLTKFQYQGKTIIATPAQDFYITPNFGKNEIRLAFVLPPNELKQAMIVLQKGLEAYAK